MEILGVKEDEIELSLGLSIGGGSFRKFEKKSSLSSSSITFDSKIFDSRREIEASSCYDEDDGLDLDKRKHEIHKMRRQEGQKKREIENEEEGFEQICKKLKVEDEKTLNQNPNNLGHSSLAFPMIPMQYRFHEPMQYVPFGNGFTFPYHQMMPCWIPPTSTTSSAAKNDDDKNVVQPIACKPFRPFQLSNSDLNFNLPVENCESDHSVSKFGGVKDTDSSGSCGNSSSAGSDYRSSGSHHGSEIRSRTNHSPPPSDQLHMQDSVMSNVQVQSAHSISPDPLKSPLVIKEANTNFDKVVSSNTLQSNPSKTEEEPTFTTNPLPIINKPISNTDFPPHFLPALQQLKGPNVDNYQPLKPRPPRESKGANNEDSNDKLSPLPLSPHQMKVADEEETNPIKKPNEKMNQLSPKSQPQTQPPQIQSLPKMPYVSTIGNGPNGKTITGFLYRYTKTEVSIICVCHGNSFSPAEFVKHAGGTDVSHPLRHIVVVPSAFN